MKIIINHCHLFPRGAFERDGNPRRGTLGELQGIISKLNIAKAIVFAPFEIKGRNNPNQWLCEEIKGVPDILGFATLDPKIPGSRKMLKECVKKGLVGVKIHPPIFKTKIDDPKCYPFYSLAEKLKVPLLFHTGVHGWYLEYYLPILLDKIAQEFPNLPIIIEHLGGEEFFNQASATLRNNQNCYAGITGLLDENRGWYIPLEKIINLIKRIGSSRFIYGADYPFSGLEHIKKDIEKIMNLDISEMDKENVLGGNIERLISG